MTQEYSAGGVVYKKVNGKTYWLLAQHSQHKGWVFPKGLIGDNIQGESSENTAVREVEEETGVKAKLLEKLPKPATYFYMWQKDKRFKTVTYYLMVCVSEDISKHDHEMQDVEWVDTEKVMERLTYKSDKEAFTQALELFNKLPS